MKKRKINNKGILFSIMTLVLIISVISFNTVLNNASVDIKSFDESAAMISISNRYSNISSQTLSLKKEGYPKEVFERSLPINYDINNEKKSLFISQRFPTSQALFDETFDTINFFRIFMEDTNNENIFDGINVDINAQRNSLWGGSKKQISFLTDPSCYEIITDTSFISFSKSTSEKCALPFDNSNIKQFFFGIKLSSNMDYNSVLCNGGACPSEAYDGLSHFVEIVIDDSECFNCNFTQKTISQNFDPTSDINIQIGCVGSGCTSQPIIIIHNDLDFNIQSNGSTFDFNSEVIFNSKINDFFISDINVLVEGFDGFYKKK